MTTDHNPTTPQPNASEPVTTPTEAALTPAEAVGGEYITAADFVAKQDDYRGAIFHKHIQVKHNDVLVFDVCGRIDGQVGIVFEMPSSRSYGVEKVFPANTVLRVTRHDSEPIEGLTMLIREDGSKTVYRAFKGYHQVFHDTLDDQREIATLRSDNERLRVRAETAEAALFERTNDMATIRDLMTGIKREAEYVAESKGLEINASPIYQWTKQILSMTNPGKIIVKEVETYRSALKDILNGVESNRGNCEDCDCVALVADAALRSIKPEALATANPNATAAADVNGEGGGS